MPVTISDRRGSRILFVASALAVATVLFPATTAGGAPVGPPAEPPAKSSLSTRLQALRGEPGVFDPAAATRAGRSFADDPSTGAARIPRRVDDGAPLVHVRVEPGREDAVAAAMGDLAGVEVTHSTTSFLTALVPVDLLDEVDAIDDVHAVFESMAPVTRCGDEVSEGDALMKAAAARTTHDVDGSGVTVGILSDSYDQAVGTGTTAPQDVASGDLPGVGSPCGSTTPVVVNTPFDDTNGNAPPNASDEGRAMAQIVHDLAPGADITFGSAFNGLFAFADEVRDLAADGADVIVDDIGYFVEPFFQRGPVGEAINDVVDDGATYVSAIGNDRITLGNIDLTSYETPAFRPITCTGLTLPQAYVQAGARCHDFNGGSGTDPAWTFAIPDQGGLGMNLQWNQPWLGVGTDLDILLFDMNGNAITGSIDDNLAGQIPHEFLDVPPDDGQFAFQIAVIRYAGSSTPRFKWSHLGSDLIFSEYASVSGGDVLGGGSSYGHPNDPKAIGVGAAPYFAPTSPEPFSSRGPGTWYWAGVGDDIDTNPLATAAPPLACRRVIEKPDVTGIDGVSNTFFGFPSGGADHRFFGTSAAAPHVAAVAALMLDADPTLTPDEVRATLARTAKPLLTGDNTQWGAGLVDAEAAVGEAIDGPARGRFVPLAPARLLDTRTGNGYSGPKPGAGSTVTFKATGRGNVPASGVEAVVLAVAASEATAAGFVTAHPADVRLPLSANLNLERAGQTISNQVVVGVSSTGNVSLFTQKGTHLIADVVGYYQSVDAPVTSGRFVPVTPDRLLDTRDGTGTGSIGAVPAQSAIELQVGGQAGVPANATGVVLNVTLTGITGPGYVTVHPANVATPLAASFTADRKGQTIGSHVTVGLSPSGAIDLFASRSTHLIADVVGYYTAASAPASEAGLFVPTTPTRFLDTRTGTGNGCGKPAANSSFELPLGGRGPLPSTGVAGAAVNLTIVQTSGPGFAVLYPANVSNPGTASVNTDAAGQIRPNLVTSGTSPSGAVDVFTNRSTHLVGDVAGYFLSG